MKCTSCNRTVRKGTGRRSLVLSPSGDAPRMGIVCARCYRRAVPVVVPPPMTIAPPCKACGRGPAAYCAACYERTCENVRTLAAANVARVSVDGPEGTRDESAGR